MGVDRKCRPTIINVEIDPTETLLGGLSSTTIVSGNEREHANQTLETFRPAGVGYLGDRGRSAGVLERNLDRSLETLLLFHSRPYMRRHYCLPHGALECDRGHRDLSPCPSLARCRTHCPEAADTTIQTRCLNRDSSPQPVRKVRAEPGH